MGKIQNMPQVKGTIDKAVFESWLRTQGAEVLPTTSAWEFARFRARESLHIIYRRITGVFSAEDFGLECLAAYRRGTPISMGLTTKRKALAHRKEGLFKRDGTACFFCGIPMTEEEATIEHLIPISRGGPNTDDNLALAHQSCNLAAGAAPLMDKIRKYCAVRIQQASRDHQPQTLAKDYAP